MSSIPRSAKRPVSILARLAISMVVLSTAAFAQVNVLTYHNDNLRSGLNPSENILTPATVSEQTFGLLHTLPVDGAVYGQPLSVAGVKIPGQGTHNVIYVATQHDSVFAFDASGTSTTPLWQVNLGPSVPNGDTGSGDIQPEIGITSTPVIHLTGTGAGYLYVVAKTKESNGSGGYNYVQRLHALDITTGAEALGGPTLIQATVNGVGDGNDGNGHVPFNPLIQNARPGLLYYSNGATNLIVIAFASHGDNGPYHGWVMTYDAKSLQQVSVFNTTPNALTDPSGYPIAAGGVWQGGGGVASDGTDLYFATGNGTFDPSTEAYGDSVLKMTSSLSVLDYFAPLNQQSLNDSDGDLGSGGVLLVPNDTTYNPTAQLMVQAGKDGTLHLISRNSLGHFNATVDHIAGEFQNVMGGVWGNPAYFNGTIFYGPSSGALTTFGISGGKLVGNGPTAYSSNAFGYPGPTPAVSSLGTNNGIVWAVDGSAYLGSGNTGPSQLWAYNASTMATLYSSQNSGDRDVMGTAVKFTTPLIEGGHVYVGTMNSVEVFGLGTFTHSPYIHTPGGIYRQPSLQVTISDSDTNAKIYYTLNGTTPTQNSPLYSGPITLTSNASLEVKAWTSGEGPSGVSKAYYQINPDTGTGTGLEGLYYNNNTTATGTVTTHETTPDINFNWNGNPPVYGVGGDNWSANFIGTVLAPVSGYYTFYLTSDDGSELWINGHQLISQWEPQAPTTQTSAPFYMNKGQQYSVRINYFQDGGGSVLQLAWSALGMPQQIIPKAQLYLPN